MDEHYEFIKQIEGRWDVYMSVVSLRGLRNYLMGYSYALFKHDLKETKTVKRNPDFHVFVVMILATTMGYNPITFNWLVFMNNYHSFAQEDHDVSIEKFYELLSQFHLNTTS